MEGEDTDWFLDIPHSPVGREGKPLQVSEWQSVCLLAPPSPAVLGTCGRKELRSSEAQGAKKSQQLAALHRDFSGAIIHGMLTKGDQRHHSSAFIAWKSLFFILRTL